MSLGDLTISEGGHRSVIYGQGIYTMHKPEKTDFHLISRTALPPYRSVNTVTIMVRFMETQGFDAAALLAGSDIHVSALDDPDFIITPVQEFHVMRNIVRLSPDPKIGLDIGRLYHVGIYGTPGAAAMSSSTLLDAIRIAWTYMALTFTYFHYDLVVKGGLAFLTMKERIDLKDLRIFISERDVAHLHRMALDLLRTPAATFQEIRFAYPKPAYAAAYQDFFGCPVRFDAGEHAIIFDSQYLFMPLPMADPLSKKKFEEECKPLPLRMQAQDTVTDRVRHAFMYQRERLPSFSQLARSVAISPRTLRRRLTQEGTSYKLLASEVLKKKAIDLLEKTSYPIDQIAMELGYNDRANFCRAFKAWTGHNPSYYRKKT